jgi:hypothetical protein
MTTILQILASPRPHSFSRRIAREVTARLVTLNPGAEIVERDLAVDPPPHPDLDFDEAILSPVPDDNPRFSLSEQMIRELEVPATGGRSRARSSSSICIAFRPNATSHHPSTPPAAPELRQRSSAGCQR